MVIIRIHILIVYHVIALAEHVRMGRIQIALDAKIIVFLMEVPASYVTNRVKNVLVLIIQIVFSVMPYFTELVLLLEVVLASMVNIQT